MNLGGDRGYGSYERQSYSTGDNFIAGVMVIVFAVIGAWLGVKFIRWFWKIN